MICGLLSKEIAVAELVERWPDVDVSLKLSCGCVTRPTGPVPSLEVVHVGAVRICDRCDDYTVVVRVTTRLHDPDVAGRLYDAAVDGTLPGSVN